MIHGVRIHLLLLLLLIGCRAAPTDPKDPPPEEAESAQEPAEDLDSVGDRGDPIPFGVALTLADGEAELLYPNLLASAALPAELEAALPLKAAGLHRMETKAGVQEDPQSSWIGAMGTYRGPGGKVTLLIQDTGWEPATLNRLMAAWRKSTTHLPDGRPVASLQPEDRGGLFAQVAAGPAVPRIVLQAQANEGVDRDLVLDVLAAVDVAALKPLLARRGDFPRSALLPADRSALVDPATLAKALPPAPDWQQVATGSGWHREQRSDLVSVAMSTYLRADGVLQLSLRDLGPRGAGVTVGAKGDLEGSADAMRRNARGGLRCDEEMGSCKSVALIDDRYLWSVVGPVDREALFAIAESLDSKLLP